MRQLEGFSQVARCEHCNRKLRLSFDVDLSGRTVEQLEFCGCAESRRLAGVCRDCTAAVEGRVGLALRCARHKRESLLRSYRKYDANNAEKRAASNREWRKKNRERKRLSGLAWRHRNPEKVRRYKNTYALRHPDKILAHYERHSNRMRADRAQMKKDWARKNQTVYLGAGKVPLCACGAEIPWTPGCGRPMKLCQTCDPVRWRQAEQRKQKAARSIAA